MHVRTYIMQTYTHTHMCMHALVAPPFTAASEELRRNPRGAVLRLILIVDLTGPRITWDIHLWCPSGHFLRHFTEEGNPILTMGSATLQDGVPDCIERRDPAEHQHCLCLCSLTSHLKFLPPCFPCCGRLYPCAEISPSFLP